MKITIGPYTDNDEERIVDIQIDDYDTWNLDHTLALIILPLLEKFKGDMERDMFYPSNINEEVNHSTEVQSISDDEEKANEGYKQWLSIIDEMIYAMKGVIDDPDFFIDYDSISHEEAKEKGYDLIDVEDLGLDITPFYVDREAQRIHDNRVREGLELFGKYFQHLWT